MIGGNRISQHGEDIRGKNIATGFRNSGIEEWRIADIGRVFLPLIGFLRLYWQTVPFCITVEYFTITLVKHLSAH